MQPDSFVLTTSSQAEFYRHHPLDFFLYDEEGNANLYILNDNVPGKPHNFILINESELPVVLAGSKAIPGEDHFHLELRFRPGTIDAAFHNWITVGTGEWLLNTKLWGKDDPGNNRVREGTVSVYLLFCLEGELVIPPGSSRLVPLHGLKSGHGGGSRGSSAELRYHVVRTENTTSSSGTVKPRYEVLTGSDSSTLRYRQERLEIINQRGIRTMPAKAGFSSGNRILNDGREENFLNLQITNALRNSQIPFQGKRREAPSRLILSFDTSEKLEYWALLDADNAIAIEVEVSDQAKQAPDVSGMSSATTFWHVEKETQGETPQWILSPAHDFELEAGEALYINLFNIITNMPSGASSLYLQYENMPGYWDDLYTVPIEKTPFYLRDFPQDGGKTLTTKVGIGTHKIDPDGPMLQIDGAGVIPRGGIILWSGPESRVPAGWQLCNGVQLAGVTDPVVPDLSAEFVVELLAGGETLYKKAYLIKI